MLLAAIVLVAGIGGLAINLPQRGALPERLAGSQVSELAAEAAARAEAITWILHQVSPGAVVSCDALVCADLTSSGFPSSSLWPLEPGSNDPLGSDLLVATATVRNQFGNRLAVYAPATIASFGTGNAKIDILWVYPDGASAYRTALRATLLVRKAADAQLLANSNIQLSPTARAQLLSGQVDPWLPDAHRHHGP